MKPISIIKDRICEQGLKTRYVSERTNIPPDKLSRSLNGKRTLKPEEFISLCLFLGIKVEEFNPTS